MVDLHKHPQQQDRTPQAAELRASDADRDRIADLLRDALAEGRLTADEHAERVEGVLAAKTVGELEVFVRDLPAGRQPRPHAPAPSRPMPGPFPPDPDDNVVAVFSAAVRKGRWRVGRRIHVYAVFGNVEIDLSEALFNHQQVVIKAYSVFGNVEVRVPENVSLRGTGGGVLGNFEVASLDAEDPQAPAVYVDGWAVLGNIEARPKRGKLVADILDRVQRTVDKSLRGRTDR
ncbi:DUF1707 and DUF2154 domain-containing protein [Streptomyces sp. S12]|uniref:DUF1707 domain-containing protein n=2 Tax=unclassified Streptomyces TaxID=2593676 RepID=A0A6G3R011_9ACTN|nr:DUF1707 domain-containing protein [Streptomyces sp. SID7958]MBM7089532.1 DUF1707 and DUF2154 domain-containing protein [Streptomyces sp. S12]NEA88935.1 DUF1707 domain-containing protein [Streptomyces sp. SID14436]NEC78633.1 DUF1707 domain-containing protein [Streptomyces sp. SID7958]